MSRNSAQPFSITQPRSQSRRRRGSDRRRGNFRPLFEQLEKRIELAKGFIEIDTSLENLDLSGGPYPMPLASDPGNALGDSVDGFGFVNSQVSVTLSSQRAGQDLQIVLQDIRHRAFTNRVISTTVTDEIENFEFELVGTAIVTSAALGLNNVRLPVDLSEVHVFFEGANEGDAKDDDGDGLEEVITELVKLKLTDGNVTLRIRDVAKSPFGPSLGEIAERITTTTDVLDTGPFASGVADSFLDLDGLLILLSDDTRTVRN